MKKIVVFKEQRIGGNRRQYMQSIGFVRKGGKKTAQAGADKEKQDAKLTDGYTEWVAAKDEEIGFWESLYPFWL